MSIGTRIKELREYKGLTRNDLAESLGVTIGAISNYENGVSSPKEPILFKIIEKLGCDANYLFQDEIKMPSDRNDVSIPEYEYITKYRELDEHGKDMVDFVLIKEWERSVQRPDIFSFNNKETLSCAEENTEIFQLNAAHAIESASEEDKKHDDDIMDDENF